VVAVRAATGRVAAADRLLLAAAAVPAALVVVSVAADLAALLPGTQVGGQALTTAFAAHSTVHRAAALAAATDAPLRAAVLLPCRRSRGGTADRLIPVAAVSMDIQRVGTAAPDPGRTSRILQAGLVRPAADVATAGFPVAALVRGHARAIGARRLRRALPVPVDADLAALAALRALLRAAGLLGDTAAGAPPLVGTAGGLVHACPPRRAFAIGAALLAGTALVLAHARAVGRALELIGAALVGRDASLVFARPLLWAALALLGTDPIGARLPVRGDALAALAVAAGGPAPLAAHAIEGRVRHAGPLFAHLTLVAVLTTRRQRRRLVALALPFTLALPLPFALRPARVGVRLGPSCGLTGRVRLVLHRVLSMRRFPVVSFRLGLGLFCRSEAGGHGTEDTADEGAAEHA